MPFWYGHMWGFPAVMPIIMIGIFFLLLKKGFFSGRCGQIKYNVEDDNNEFNENGAALTPLEILKRRYAKGEITREEYKEMKEELKE